MTRKWNIKNRKLIVEELLHDGTAMCSIYDVSEITNKLLEKGVDFKLESLKNGIYMITVMRINVEQKTA